MKVRISNGGKFLDIDYALVFEAAGTVFPEEWKEHVSVNSQSKGAVRKAQWFSKLEEMLWKKAGAI